jgi:RNA polymerase sigma factor (TIGR02999 family)
LRAHVEVTGARNASATVTGPSSFQRGKLAGMSEVTRILSAVEQGDPHAAEQLLPLVYDELRQLAAQRLAQEKPGQTLQATALVHEAYLRLVDVEKAQHWNSRGHFFAAAAEAMRRILVEEARRKQRHKHGGSRQKLPLDANLIADNSGAEELLAINDALDQLASQDAQAARLVKLRYFSGLSVEEAAEAIGIPRSTAYVHWSFARAALRVLLETDTGGHQPEFFRIFLGRRNGFRRTEGRSPKGVLP